MDITSRFREKLTSSAKTKTIIFITTLLTLIPLAFSPLASADQYQTQINQLQQQNSSNQAAQAQLQTQAATLSDQVASLQAKIASIETQITDNQQKSNELRASIAEKESQITKEKQTLGKSVRQMYLESDMSTAEKLASSKDLSDYVDKEQYRISVQNKITESVALINKLKKEQLAQKSTVDKLLSDQQTMQTQLASQKAEVNRLLGLNQSEQAAYEQRTSANNTKITELQRLQAIENAKNFYSVQTGGSGGYPWANAPFPNSIVDPWGMYQRQCVSYTAWKVASTGRHMPYWGGFGNAKQWDDNARAAGIPVDYSPRVGDVAISNAGTYGHAMYVEAVNGDGSITVSQYNANWDGTYSVGRRSLAGLVFIHF